MEKSITKIPDTISTLLQDDKVIIISKVNAGYHKTTIKLFKKKGIYIELLDVDQVNLTDKQQEELFQLTGLKTYPMIFIGKTPLGGYVELKEYERSGKLDALAKIKPKL